MTLSLLNGEKAGSFQQEEQASGCEVIVRWPISAVSSQPTHW